MDTMNRSTMIARRPLVTALRLCASVVARRNAIPILDTVHLIARHDGLILRATDLDRDLEITLPADGAALDTCAPLYDLLAIVSKLPGDSVTLELSEAGLRINGVANLPVRSPQDFPQMERRAPGTEFDLPSDHLTKLLTVPRAAIPRDEVRFYLNGVFLEPERGYLRATATDGCMLISTAVPGPDASAKLADTERNGIIIPRLSVETLIKLMPKKPASIHVALHSEDRLSFHGDNWRYTTKLVGGTFPDWRRVIPGLHNSVHNHVGGRVVMDAAELRAALTVILAAMGKDRSPGVKYEFESNTCTLSWVSPDGNSAQQTVSCEWIGDLPVLPFAVGFKATYMRDFLAQQTGAIEWQFQRDTAPKVSDVAAAADGVKPVALLDPGCPLHAVNGVDPETIYVLMPMRVL